MLHRLQFLEFVLANGLSVFIRFWAKGWIEKLYIDPVFHFKYYGFEWVTEAWK